MKRKIAEWPVEKKLEAVRAMQRGLTAEEVSALTGMSKSIVYRCLRRYKKAGVERARTRRRGARLQKEPASPEDRGGGAGGVADGPFAGRDGGREGAGPAVPVGVSEGIARDGGARARAPEADAQAAGQARGATSRPRCATSRGRVPTSCGRRTS